MTTVPSCYTGQFVGTSGSVGVWYVAVFGTLHHTVGQWRTLREVGQTKVRSKLTGGMLDAHTQTWIQAFKQMHIHTQADTVRRTPSFQPVPHLGNSYFRKEHIRTHIASSSPPFYSPLPLLLPPSLWPSSSPLLSSLSFLRQYYTSHRLQSVFLI